MPENLDHIIGRHLPLQAESGEDYAEVFDRHGEKVALTVRPELILALNDVPVLLEALRRIYHVGDGHGKHDPPDRYAGTTGDGHAQCRAIAEAAIRQAESRCPKCGGTHADRYEGACDGPPTPSAPPPHGMMG